MSLWLTLATTLMVGCSEDANQFVAEGTITDAQGETLYLEEVGTGHVISLDSVRLDEAGQFRFAHDGTRYPMFYRLRLGNQSIPFAADSLTHLVVRSTGGDFFTSYTLEEADPYNYQIREVAHLRHQTDQRVDSVLALYTAGHVSLEEARQAVNDLAAELKRTLTHRYIYSDTKSPVAYFALYQRKGDGAYFSAEEDGDERAFAAVATAYDLYYADAPYTPFLKDMALHALARSRARRSWDRASSQAEAHGVATLDFPDIKLVDSGGTERQLSTIAEGGPVLLSFTAYQAQWSPLLVASLRELQSRRPGLTIYEVSVDGDHYFWQNATRTLPWICVNDPEGRALLSYNVQELPAFFYIEGKELRRISSPKELL